jgi:adenylate cyclase
VIAVTERDLSLREAADLVGVTPATLKRWAQTGVIPEHSDAQRWTPVAVSHARMVSRLRDRGHTLDELRQAGADGRLAYGFVEELLAADDDGEERIDFDDAAEEVGLEPALVERIWATLGFAPRRPETIGAEDLRALRYVASVLDAGFPLVAFL